MKDAYKSWRTMCMSMCYWRWMNDLIFEKFSPTWHCQSSSWTMRRQTNGKPLYFHVTLHSFMRQTWTSWHVLGICEMSHLWQCTDADHVKKSTWGCYGILGLFQVTTFWTVSMELSHKLIPKGMHWKKTSNCELSIRNFNHHSIDN